MNETPDRYNDYIERISSKRTSDRVRRLTAEDLLSTESGSEIELPGIHALVVEGLLSFGAETSFEFGRLNILVGPNGTGKSNLIDCFRILRSSPFDIQEAFRDTGFEGWLYRNNPDPRGSASLQAIVSVPEVHGRILHRLRLGPPLSSRAPVEEAISGIGVDDASPLYFVGSHRGRAQISVAGTGKRRRDRELPANQYDPFQSILSQVRDMTQYPEVTRLASLYSNLRIYSEWTFGRSSNLREATLVTRTDALLSESMSDLALALNGLEGSPAHEKIRRLLSEVKETYRDYVTRTLFGRVGLELLEAPLTTPLPAKRLSDGTLRFLALAAILLHPKPPAVLCIEEPELGMHPDLIRVVSDMIIDASRRTQLIISTHSELLLSALQDDFDVLFAFDAGLDGTVIRRFSQLEYANWRQEHSLGELWTSGELGGNRW